VRHAHLVDADKAYAAAQAEFVKTCDAAARGNSGAKPRKRSE